MTWCLKNKPEEPSFSNLAGQVVRNKMYISKMKAKSKQILITHLVSPKQKSLISSHIGVS